MHSYDMLTALPLWCLANRLQSGQLYDGTWVLHSVLPRLRLGQMGRTRL